MKKSILVVLPSSLELGGIERSLLGLLGEIDYTRYDVDLFLYGHHGALFPLIPKEVNLLSEYRELAYMRESFGDKLRHGAFLSAALRLYEAVLAPFTTVDHDKTWRHLLKTVKSNPKEYDLALGFFMPFDYLFDKVKAKYRVGWVHTDYQSEGVPREKLLDDYRRLDAVAAVSEATADAFRAYLPEYADKTFVVENILSEASTAQLSKEEAVGLERREGGYTVLSVGRFCYAKNFDTVPTVVRLLKERGIALTWYLIGFGTDEPLIRRRIEENGVENEVVILGKKDNPYPYIAACDLYCQPSRFEGKCVAVREAQLLGRPVAVTDYPTAKSQVRDGFDGVILPQEPEAMAEALAALLLDEEKRRTLAENCRRGDYTNKEAVKMLLSRFGLAD